MIQRYSAHPWHGISPGKNTPKTVTAYIEIVPTDTVKYELDKESGLLKIDRPQKYSNLVPALYGFIPQTYCGKQIAAFAAETWKDIEHATPAIIERLRHYFLTYKNMPGEAARVVEITHVYGREEAHEVIRRSIDDYQKEIINP
jgi:inorganic pyrophosphatase